MTILFAFVFSAAAQSVPPDLSCLTIADSGPSDPVFQQPALLCNQSICRWAKNNTLTYQIATGFSLQEVADIQEGANAWNASGSDPVRGLDWQYVYDDTPKSVASVSYKDGKNTVHKRSRQWLHNHNFPAYQGNGSTSAPDDQIVVGYTVRAYRSPMLIGSGRCAFKGGDIIILSDPENLDLGTDPPPIIVAGERYTRDEMLWNTSTFVTREISLPALVGHEFGHLLGLGHETMTTHQTSMMWSAFPYGADTTYGTLMRSAEYRTMYNATDNGTYLFRDNTGGPNIYLSRWTARLAALNPMETWGAESTSSNVNDPLMPQDPNNYLSWADFIPGTVLGAPILLGHIGTALHPDAEIKIKWLLLYDADGTCANAATMPNRLIALQVLDGDEPLISGQRGWQLNLQPGLLGIPAAPLSSQGVPSSQPRLCVQVTRTGPGFGEATTLDNVIISDDDARFFITL